MNNEKEKIDFGDILKKAAQSSASSTPQSPNELGKLINSGLSEEQKKKLGEVLADEEKTKTILESEAAKELFRKLTGGKNNG